MEIFYKDSKIFIVNKEKKQVVFDYKNNEVKIEDFLVNFPWEYEKSSILLEVKEYNNELFYNFLIDWKHLLIVNSDNFELKEEILDFFWDVDILLIKWTKNATKIFENIEAKLVIPYGEEKDIFLNSLWQQLEEIDNCKIKQDLPVDTTEFVNLKVK